MTELLMAGWVRLTIALDISPRRLDAIMEGTPLQIIRVLGWGRIPTARLRLIALLRRGRCGVSSLSTLQMFYGHEIPAFVCLAVGLPRRKGHLRVAEFIVRGWIEGTMTLEIASRRLDAVVEGTALQIVRVVGGRRIPSPLSLLVRRRRTLWRPILGEGRRKRKEQGTSKKGGD